MGNTIVLLSKEYHGFEDFYDYSRDVAEVFEFPEDENAKRIKGEFKGIVKVVVTFTPATGDLITQPPKRRNVDE